MSTTVIAFDVGGTNTRARVSSIPESGIPRRIREDIASPIASAGGLYDFASHVIEIAKGDGPVGSAVVAVAGPVNDGESRLTNWSSDPVVSLKKLELAGLPPDRTQLVNDVVAGAWGSLARIEASAPDTLLQHPSRGHGDTSGLGEGNLVYVAPGTGLGAAALVRHHLGALGATAVGCEAQHAQMPSFAGPIGEVSDALAVSLGSALTWEDLVSGRGLTRIYDARCSLASKVPLYHHVDDASRAGSIASAALHGGDPQAVAAVDVFYRVLGHFAQTLALSFLPCVAVVIGGASTQSNFALVRRGGLAEAFVDNRRFGELLANTPVHTVGGEVNLEGGVWLASRA